MRPMPAAPNRDAAPAAPAAVPTALAVREVQVENGRLTWHDERNGRSVSVQVPRLNARAASADLPVVLTASLMVDGRSVTLSGRTGPIARLLAASATAPWPVQITLDTHGASLTASGSLGQPLSGRGYVFQVTAAAADLSTFSGLAGIRLPPLHDVEAMVSLADGGGAWPTLSRLLLRVGASDLQSLAPGLALSQAEVSAPGADEPLHVDLQGSLRDTKLHLAGQARHAGGAAADRRQGRRLPDRPRRRGRGCLRHLERRHRRAADRRASIWRSRPTSRRWTRCRRWPDGRCRRCATLPSLAASRTVRAAMPRRSRCTASPCNCRKAISAAISTLPWADPLADGRRCAAR